MRVSREQAARNRERVVAAAAKLFRSKGIDATGVDAVMAEAGLTHGSFYKMFASKEDLVAESCKAVSIQGTPRWLEGDASIETLGGFVANYLCREHLDSPDRGCILAALAADGGRREGPVRAELDRAFARFLGDLGRTAESIDPRRKDRWALAAASLLVGALVLARTVEDRNRSLDILDAARDAVLSLAAAAAAA